MSSIKGRYARIEIPLNKAETEKELHITGDYLSVISITGSGTCEIKIDHRHSQTIDLREIATITGPYERLFFSSDGAGGTCSVFVGYGVSIQLSSDPKKRWNGSPTSTQVATALTVVKGFASEPFILHDVKISNASETYSALIGPYNAHFPTFRAYAFRLFPEQNIEFTALEMYSMGCLSYDSTHNVVIHILGTYE